jgi:hypothetical protein
MAWLCLKDNALSGSQMCIVTGPRIDLAIALIDRMKKLFAGSSNKGPIGGTHVLLQIDSSLALCLDIKKQSQIQLLTTAITI